MCVAYRAPESKMLLIKAVAVGVTILGAATGVPARAQVVQGEEHCVVNVKTSDGLNVREKPSAQAALVTTLRYGNCGVVVTGACAGSWCPIEAGHNAGWVNSRYISMVSPAMYCVASVGLGDGLNLRAFPSTTSTVLTVLDRQQCEISFLPFAVGNWQKVRVARYEGWANRKFLSGQ
jgi:SH3-like domain-containing protein